MNHKKRPGSAEPKGAADPVFLLAGADLFFLPVVPAWCTLNTESLHAMWRMQSGRMKDMKISYIDHSGFLVETGRCYYLFDYYRKKLPQLDCKKPIFVFASHRHPDHYNPEIFTLLQEMGMEQVTAVLSKDISRKKYPDAEAYRGNLSVVTVNFNGAYGLPCETKLYTFHSTDEGVAFLLTCPEGVLYHAGDLNDWVWEGEPERDNRQMTGSYRHEINLIAGLLQDKGIPAVDLAFVPLDPRQEKDYDRGLLYFLKKIPVKQVYPMHYWGNSDVIGQFLREYPEYTGIIQDTETAGKEKA